MRLLKRGYMFATVVICCCMLLLHWAIIRHGHCLVKNCLDCVPQSDAVVDYKMRSSSDRNISTNYWVESTENEHLNESTAAYQEVRTIQFTENLN